MYHYVVSYGWVWYGVLDRPLMRMSYVQKFINSFTVSRNLVVIVWQVFLSPAVLTCCNVSVVCVCFLTPMRQPTRPIIQVPSTRIGI